jgi:hypothetical protein
MNRHSDTIREELRVIAVDNADFNNPVGIVASALMYGYGTQRTTFHTETFLHHANDLEALCEAIAATWDGNDYINGALYAAREYTHAREPMTETQQPTTTYQFISDPGHGWLRVPLAEIAGETYSAYSYQDAEFAYLEEDCDAGKFMKAHHVTPDQVEARYIDRSAFIRNLPRLEAQPPQFAAVDTGESLPQLTFAPAPDQQLRMF